MRLKWLGHVLRFDDNNTVKQLLKWIPEGSNRPVGRPIFRFWDAVRRDALFCQKRADIQTLEYIAQDREEWREFVAAAMDRSP